VNLHPASISHMSSRSVVQVGIRSFCAILAGVAVFSPIWTIAKFTIQWDYGRMLYRPWSLYFQLLGERIKNEALPLMASLVLFAVLLWLIQRPLARLLAPRIARACPECGYDLRKNTSGRCPECGAEGPNSPANAA
jgi:hypothetical protein